MKCAVADCENRVRGRKKGLSFHNFPIDKEKRKFWLRCIRQENMQITRHTRICSEHFPEYTRITCCGRTKLIDDALPEVGIPLEYSTVSQVESDEETDEAEDPLHEDSTESENDPLEMDSGEISPTRSTSSVVFPFSFVNMDPASPEMLITPKLETTIEISLEPVQLADNTNRIQIVNTNTGSVPDISTHKRPAEKLSYAHLKMSTWDEFVGAPVCSMAHSSVVVRMDHSYAKKLQLPLYIPTLMTDVVSTLDNMHPLENKNDDFCEQDFILDGVHPLIDKTFTTVGTNTDSESSNYIIDNLNDKVEKLKLKLFQKNMVIKNLKRQGTRRQAKMEKMQEMLKSLNVHPREYKRSQLFPQPAAVQIAEP